ncbi:hypothetical protein BE20_35345 [Sorangium cellulosum]|nr:hypothetical protein BE20_35345 [Sorangium cellulosum]
MSKTVFMSRARLTPCTSSTAKYEPCSSVPQPATSTTFGCLSAAVVRTSSKNRVATVVSPA